MNILDSLKGLVTDELVNKAAGALGEDGGAISNVMKGAIPAVLGGLLGSDSKKHGDLAGLFGQAASNDNLMGDLLGGLTGAGNNNSGGFMNSIISGIFGDKIGGIANILTNLGGLKNAGTSSSMLGMVGTMVASFLGKKMMKDGLSFSGIMNLLGGEKDAIMDAAPAGMNDVLGIKRGPWNTVSDAVTNVVGNTSNTVKGAVTGAAGAVTGAAGSVVSGAGNLASDTVDTAKKGMKWLWPLLLLAALALGLIWMLNQGGCSKGVEETTSAISGQVEDVAAGAGEVLDSAGAAIGDVAGAAAGALNEAGDWVAAKGEAVSLKLENGTELASTKGSVIEKLYSFAKDPAAVPNKDLPANWFNFEDLLFESGSANLKAGSETQIANAVAILKAYPSVKIKLGGYTDNTGDSAKNVTLSESRAKTVYNKMIAGGATAASFDAKPFEGYGSQYPVASNDTPEGRAQNRRIACVVTAK